MTAAKKKLTLVDDTPISAPLFAKHHYLILESSDGHLFYVDRNAAITSRLIAAALKELANRADEELDDFDGLNAAVASTHHAAPAFAILGGDVIVKCNGEKAAIATAQLPIVHTNTLLAATLAQQQQQFQQRPGTGDTNQISSRGMGGGASLLSSKGGAGGGGANNAKANQQLLQQQEQLAAQLAQYQQVDAALTALSELPTTHLQLVHFSAPLMGLAIRFMQYIYKNDNIIDAEQRHAFYGFITNRSFYQPNAAATGTSLTAAATGAPPLSGTTGSPSKQIRKSVTPSGGVPSAPPVAAAVDPISGGGVAVMPPVGSQLHLELLAISTLLQL